MLQLQPNGIARVAVHATAPREGNALRPRYDSQSEKSRSQSMPSKVPVSCTLRARRRGNTPRTD
eukprot:14870785-Alexandrium_andersonii.AAC.1